MNIDNLTMGRVARDSFPNAVADYLRAVARQSVAAHGSTMAAQKHAATLESLAGYVQAIGNGDQRVRALELAQPRRGEFTPGSEQQKFLAWVASTGKPAMDNSDALHELLGVAVEDMAKRLAEEASGVRRELERLTQQAQQADAYREQAEQARAKVEAAAAHRAGLDARIAELEQSVAFFRKMHPDVEPDGPTESSVPADDVQPSRKRDRKPVPGEPYIYDRIGAKGGVSYSVQIGSRYTNAVHSLDEARAERDRLYADGTLTPKDPEPQHKRGTASSLEDVMTRLAA